MLPNPGMSFSPFAILTAAELNDLVENIESLADGSGFDVGAIDTEDIATNAVEAPNISTSAITLGETSKTSTQDVTSASDTSVTSLPLTVTIPAGGRDVELVVMIECAGSATSVNYSLKLWDGAVGSGVQLREWFWSAAVANVAVITPVCLVHKIPAPAAGSKTYRLSIASNGSATFRIYAAATTPATMTAYIK